MHCSILGTFRIYCGEASTNGKKKKKEAVNDKRTLIQCLSVERAPSRLHNKYVSELKIEGVDGK